MVGVTEMGTIGNDFIRNHRSRENDCPPSSLWSVAGDARTSMSRNVHVLLGLNLCRPNLGGFGGVTHLHLRVRKWPESDKCHHVPDLSLRTVSTIHDQARISRVDTLDCDDFHTTDCSPASSRIALAKWPPTISTGPATGVIPASASTCSVQLISGDLQRRP